MSKTLISRYDYNLSDDKIAKYPNKERDTCKLLVLNRSDAKIKEGIFKNILDYIDDDYLIVLNDTRVMNSRIPAKKITGGKSEVFILEVLSSNSAKALLKGKFNRNDILLIDRLVTATVVDILVDGVNILKFNADLYDIMQRYGKVPLPPYINRDTDENDNIDYQTVYAKNIGSSASPTAGLHFSVDLLSLIKAKGIEIAYITLDVGLGTFRPVKSEYLEDHKMHIERYNIPISTAEMINRYKQTGKKILAVGTTVVRALESAVDDNNLIKAGNQQTDILISEGYKFKVVDSLVTNFHLPKSTLLALVSAFAGYENIITSYEYAIDNDFLFFSYGDAMFII